MQKAPTRGKRRRSVKEEKSGRGVECGSHFGKWGLKRSYMLLRISINLHPAPLLDAHFF